MNNSQKVILGTTILVAAVMAYFIKDIIREIFFEPFSYVWYAVNLVYLSVAQVVYWYVLVVVFALIAFGSLYGKFHFAKSVEEDLTMKYGPVANIARYISRSGEGIYYKWLMANRLGQLARSVLGTRSGTEYSLEDELNGRDGSPPVELQAYFDSGLKQTFADFPRQKRFARQPETPLDIDIEQVIKYLESQMEDLHD